MASAYPSENISLDCGGDKLTLRCKRHRYQISTLPAEDFPTLDTGDCEPIELSGDVLLSRIDAVLGAVAKSDVRYYLNGALIEPDGHGARIVGTDGHRLITHALPIESGTLSRSLILPRESLEMMRGIIKGEPVTLGVGESKVSVSTQNASMASTVIDGRFPDWRRVVPEQVQYQAAIDRQELMSALQGVRVIGEKHAGVRLTFDEHALELEVVNSQRDEGGVIVDLNWQQPPPHPITVGFNIAYLLDALAAFSDDTVLLHFTGSDASAKFTSDDDDGLIAVVMPMRL